MSKRFTETAKWDDPWFWHLGLEEKILFLYLCDACDLAGFFKWDPALVAMKTGIKAEEAEKVIYNIVDSKDVDGRQKVFIRNSVVYLDNYIKVQDPNGLSLKDPAHIGIIKRLMAMMTLFPECLHHLPSTLTNMKGELRTLIRDCEESGKRKTREKALIALQKQVEKAEEKLKTTEIPENERPLSQAELFPREAPQPVKYCLHLLKNVRNYPFNIDEDTSFLMALMVDYPDVDIVAQIKKKIDWWRDNKLTSSSNPRLQIRNWIENSIKFKREAQEKKREMEGAKFRLERKRQLEEENRRKRELELEREERDKKREEEDWLRNHLEEENIEEVMEKFKVERKIAIYLMNLNRKKYNLPLLPGGRDIFKRVVPTGAAV